VLKEKKEKKARRAKKALPVPRPHHRHPN
jgi:hypothetical protein